MKIASAIVDPVHWWFQTWASPGKISGQMWLLLTETRSSSAARVACLGNLATLKPTITQYMVKPRGLSQDRLMMIKV